jgi:outer membrane protein
MKNIQSILLLIVAAAVAVLYVLHFSGKKPKEAAGAVVKKDSADIKEQHIRVAYIDLDTIQKYYEYFKLKNDDIEREKNRYDNQIQGELNKLERDYYPG